MGAAATRLAVECTHCSRPTAVGAQCNVSGVGSVFGVLAVVTGMALLLVG